MIDIERKVSKQILEFGIVQELSVLFLLKLTLQVG